MLLTAAARTVCMGSATAHVAGGGVGGGIVEVVVTVGRHLYLDQFAFDQYGIWRDISHSS